MIARVVVPGPTRQRRPSSTRSIDVAGDRRLRRSDRESAVRALPPCRRPGSTGTRAQPCSRGEMDPARSASSSMSMTSASVVSRRPPRTQSSASRPALPGLTAKTAECIFTPAGMPSTGTRPPTAASTSTAVPSPPAKSRRSIPASASAAAAARVSAPVVAPRRPPITSGSMPALAGLVLAHQARPRREARSLRRPVRARGAPSPPGRARPARHRGRSPFRREPGRRIP